MVPSPRPAFAAFVLVALAAAVHANNPISLTFRQRISHDPHVPSPGYFNQRYFLSGDPKDMKFGAPLILYIGAEETTGSWSAMEGVFEPTTWALETGGLLLSVEHRYFGESLPFGNESYTNENLRFLTVENDLADCVAILQHVRMQAPGGHPVMAFGGSYGGMLAAAIRLHYPTVINASLASAGPVYMVGEVANSTWYDEVSDTLLAVKSSTDVPYSCSDAISKGFSDLWASAQQPDSWSGLQSRFGLCDPVSTSEELVSVLLWAKLAFSEIVQFAYPRAQPPTDVANAIDVVCSPSVKDVLQKATSLIYNFTEPWGTPVSCFKAFTPSSTLPVTGAGPTSHMLPRPHGVGRHALAAAIASKSVPSVEDDVHNLGGAVTITQVPWDYLCCTEIVMPIAGRGIFAMPEPYSFAAVSAYCNATYGVMPDPTWHRRYLLDYLGNATNILFSNGGYDPARGFDPATDLSSAVPVLDIANMAHTFDLFATKPGDPSNVVKARETEWRDLQHMLQLHVAPDDDP